jgi:nitrite reductase/ring-hydroxylating ferredoxin subunit
VSRRDEATLPERDLPPGAVRRLGGYAAVNDRGRVVALSRTCRHQLADLSRGRLDGEGCLVCPWHGSRYDTRTGEMVSGPRGFLGYHGPTPGYTGLVLAIGRRLRLAVRQVVREDGRLRLR